MELKKHHYSKINGMRELSRWFGGIESWRIYVKDHNRDGIRSCVREATTSEFCMQVQSFAALNNAFGADKGCDIFAAPQDDKHLFIQVDDIDLKMIQNSGYEPCAVLLTSTDNYQAIVRVERTGDDAVDQAACAVLTCELRDELNGDPKMHTSWKRGFRIPGFVNRKPEHAGSDFTKLIKSGLKKGTQPGHVDPIANVRFAEIAKTICAKMAMTMAAMKIDPSQNDNKPLQAALTGERAYAMQIALAEKLVRDGTWEKLNFSNIDYRVARAMEAAGYNGKDIGCAIASFSPELRDRKDGRVSKYIEETVRQVFQKADEGRIENAGKSLDMV
jgi:hypothetical protein